GSESTTEESSESGEEDESSSEDESETKASNDVGSSKKETKSNRLKENSMTDGASEREDTPTSSMQLDQDTDLLTQTSKDELSKKSTTIQGQGLLQKIFPKKQTVNKKMNLLKGTRDNEEHHRVENIKNVLQ